MKKRGITLFLLIIISLLISFHFDSQISSFFASLGDNILTYIFLIVTLLSHTIFLFLFLTGLFLWKKHKRKWILPLWFSLVISTIITYTLKVITHRTRPFQALEIVFPQILFNKSTLLTGILTWNSPFSFPSMHALAVFVGFVFILKGFPKLKYVWLTFACLVALSRIYFGLHFLSDVIAGGLIGYAIGMIIIKIEKKNKFWEKIYKKIFKIKK